MPRIKAIHQPNGGICSATNAALAACSGDVVMLLDWIPEPLTRYRVHARALFVSYSQLIFGTSPFKSVLRKLLRRS